MLLSILRSDVSKQPLAQFVWQRLIQVSSIQLGVSGDSWIQTVDGLYQAKDLENKQTQLVVNGDQKDSNGFRQLEKTVQYTVTTNYGYDVTCSESTYFLVKNQDYDKFQIKQVKEITVGDQIYINYNDCIDYQFDRKQFDLGWILGEVIGDGCHNPQKYDTQLYFCCQNKECLAWVAFNIVKSQLPQTPKSLKSTKPANHGTKCVKIRRKSLTNFCSKYISSYYKDILPNLMVEDKGFCFGCMQGLIDADGCVWQKRKSLILSNSNLHNLRSVQQLLLLAGISSNLFKAATQKKYSITNSYGVTYSGYEILAKNINWKMQYEVENIGHISRDLLRLTVQNVLIGQPNFTNQ
eukprot:TRINITY_DN10569_c0_g2_i8.p2 TRINITY_DN10569_c0_g2~~TRINITY_DN10569_c0_g2_i8.p2  ORF type:complete len:351 (-),score=3.18 TRINITY_DN10569_c0_g2_i8:622-1674(-)